MRRSPIGLLEHINRTNMISLLSPPENVVDDGLKCCIRACYGHFEEQRTWIEAHYVTFHWQCPLGDVRFKLLFWTIKCCLKWTEELTGLLKLSCFNFSVLGSQASGVGQLLLTTTMPQIKTVKWHFAESCGILPKRELVFRLRAALAHFYLISPIVQTLTIFRKPGRV